MDKEGLMKLTPLSSLMLICAFFFTSATYAIPSDKEVAKWTSNILLQTITVNYKELQVQAKRKTVGKYYSGQAWSGLGDFFGSVIPRIIKYRLRTNPVPTGLPRVTKKGLFDDMKYWQVTQTFYFPNINKYVWFSVMVVQNLNPPLIIENLNMRMDDTPYVPEE